MFPVTDATDEAKAQVQHVADNMKHNKYVYIEELSIDRTKNTFTRTVYIEGQPPKTETFRFGCPVDGTLHGTEIPVSLVRVHS